MLVVQRRHMVMRTRRTFASSCRSCSGDMRRIPDHSGAAYLTTDQPVALKEVNKVSLSAPQVYIEVAAPDKAKDHDLMLFIELTYYAHEGLTFFRIKNLKFQFKGNLKWTGNKISQETNKDINTICYFKYPVCCLLQTHYKQYTL